MLCYELPSVEHSDGHRFATQTNTKTWCHSSGVAPDFICFAIINKINDRRDCLENWVRVYTSKHRLELPHDDAIKWKQFQRNWTFARRIHWSPVNSPHRGHWRGALIFSMICVWINGWANNREAGDLRRHRDHFDITVMNQNDYVEVWTKWLIFSYTFL